jgi:hypothetical protein
VEGKLDSFLEVDVELELIQIDSDWPVFGTFRHFFIHSKRLKKQEILFELKMIEKTGRSEPYGNLSDATSNVNFWEAQKMSLKTFINNQLKKTEQFQKDIGFAGLHINDRREVRSYEMIKSGKTGNYFSEGQTRIYPSGLNEPLKGD